MHEDEPVEAEIPEKKSWEVPVVYRIRIGDAEFGDISSADGQPGFS